MNISSEHGDFAKALAFYRFIDDCLAGEEKIKACRKHYMPLTAGMRALQSDILTNSVNATDDDVYALYNDLVARAQYPSWPEEAVLVMVGLVAQILPTVELPARLKYLEENATSDGFSLTELFQRVCYHLIRYGKTTLVGDVDENGKGYISLYDAYSEYNWCHRVVDGRKDLAMVAFKEDAPVNPNDYFDHTTFVQRRAYMINELGEASVWLSSEHSEKAILFSDTLGVPNRPLKYLPVVRLSAINNILETSNPPLLPLCRASIKSYQLSGDLYSILHRSCHPQLYVTGMNTSPLATKRSQDGDMARLSTLNYTGAGTIWTLPKDATVGYAEPQGTGITKVAEEMGRQKSSALEAGAKVMDIGVESGDAREARQNDQYATLYSIIKNSAKAIEQVMRYIFDMTNHNEDKSTEYSIKYEVPTDFGRYVIDGTLAAHLLTAAERGAISFSTYWNYITTGKMPERTLLEELGIASKESIKLKPITGMVQATKEGDAS